MVVKQNIKAELKIVLHAGNTVIAESCDPILWQKVLAAISTPVDSSTDANLGDIGQTDIGDLSHAGGATGKMAKEIGVSVDVLKGACGPSASEPFIHLDKPYWEAMKKNTPERGAKAIAPLALAATLLILWKEKAKLGNSTIKDAQAVLGTLGQRDNHASRSIKNCGWLQLRQNNIIINPAKASNATLLAKAYCTQEWNNWQEE